MKNTKQEGTIELRGFLKLKIVPWMDKKVSFTAERNKRKNNGKSFEPYFLILKRLIFSE